jgi:AcrR family transcriptional regulator
MRSGRPHGREQRIVPGKRVHQFRRVERIAGDGPQAPRQRVAAAGHELLTAEGYAGMTIDGVARKAGVSPQTVYALFGSKRGIVTAILERAAFGPRYAELVERALHTDEPAQRLRYAAAIARQIYDAERDLLDLCSGAGLVAPELSKMLREREGRRYEAQAPQIAPLEATGRLKSGQDPQAARDILWALTGREIYRMLVPERRWSSDRYEEWLAETLVLSLMG